MYKGNDFIYEAFANLQEVLKSEISVDSNREPYDAVIQINGETFYCHAKKDARNSNSGIIFNQVNQFKNYINKNRNLLFVGEYIAKDVAESLIANDINFLDVAGNCYINTDHLKIIIEGRKQKKPQNINQARAFQEAGLKLILLLISQENALELSYRALAEKAGIALGSVSQIMKELEESNFILKTNDQRIIKNREELIERWVLAYNEVLKPRLLRKTYKAINLEELRNTVNNAKDNVIFFGGEPAAAKMTHYLKPLDYIIYSNQELNQLGRKLKLIPDQEGNIKVYNTCWSENLFNKYPHIAPPLVVYADLIGSGNNRNIETAKMILENEL
jgi:hypothetical protein